jgi:hypothetical protein
MLLPLPAGAQDVRARDLSIVENVLVDTVQQAIETTVRAINTENLQAQEAARAGNEPLPIRYVFRTGAHTQARGMFLEDYGAIFTVQVPSMSYTNSVLYAYGGNVAMVSPNDPRSLRAIVANAGALGAEMQLRMQLSRIESETAVLSERLQAELERSGAESDSARGLLESLQAWQEALNASQRYYNELLAGREAEAAADSRILGVGRADTGSEATRDDQRAAAYRIIASATPEEIAAAEELAQAQRNQIEGTVIDAVIETLSQYGRIMHGLEENDRLAVVLLPSSYLTPMSWARATQRDEEFTISVRFRDVMDLDRGTLSDEEFRGRVRIERREGQPR